ncbi:MAG: insulinase family protein [Deltaproteobacteria bacterium]|nr:insulinase family protein [Deltaproteobacteria bacterium]
MVKKALKILFILCWWFLLAGCDRAASADLYARVQEVRLDNGLKVLLWPENRAPVVTLQVWYRVGSRNEELGKTGISHLTEHLMFRGTEKYGPKVFSRQVQKFGGTDNAFTSRDYTAYYEIGPQTSLKMWLEMEADRMRNLKVSEELFRTEQQVVLEERRLRTEDDPVSFLIEDTVAAAYKAHPYQWPVIGWMHDIKSLRREDFLAYYGQYYQPNNATLVLVGDFEPEAALQEIRATFGKLPRGPEPPPFRPLEPPQQGKRQVSVHREAQLPFICLAYHVPNIGHPDAYALEVLSSILSQGRSSRLFQQLVYEKRLALDIGADYNLATACPSLFMVYAQPLPGKTVEELEQALEAELTRIKTTPVTDRELIKAKNQAESGFVMAQDSLFYRGMLLGRYQTIDSWQRLKELLPGIQAVQKKDVLRVAQQYLVPQNCTVGILHPVQTDRPIVGRYQGYGQIE